MVNQTVNSCVISGEISSPFMSQAGNVPTVTFELRSNIGTEKAPMEVTYTILCVGDAARVLNPMGIAMGDTILIQNGIFYPKDGNTVVRITAANSIVRLTQKPTYNKGVQQAADWFFK